MKRRLRGRAGIATERDGRVRPAYLIAAHGPFTNRFLPAGAGTSILASPRADRTKLDARTRHGRSRRHVLRGSGPTARTSPRSMADSSTSTAHLPASVKWPGQADRRDDRCQASAGATVKDQPEPMSTIYR